MIKQMELIPGFGGMLFQTIISGDINPAIRQAASILFKNKVRNSWSPIQDDVAEGVVSTMFPDQVKSAIKDSLLKAICVSPKNLRVQLGVALQQIVQTDFPENWPGIMEQIMQFINSQDGAQMHGALYALRVITQRYQYTAEQPRREPLYKIVEYTFPVLLPLLEFLEKHDSIESVEMQLLIIKTFYSSTEHNVPAYLINPEISASWFSILLKLLERPITLPNEPTDSEDKEKWAPWQIKKWISHILDRYFQRYGVVRESDDEASQNFSRFFAATFSPKLLESFLNLLNSPLGKTMPRKLTTACLTFVTSSIYHSQTWQLVKPHVDALFRSIFFPILMFNQEDYDTYYNEPQEFINRQFDFETEFADPRSAVLAFMVEVIKFRGESFLVTFMNFLVNDVLKRNSEVPNDKKNPSEIYAAIMAVGNLSSFLRKSKAFSDSIESIVIAHIIPHLSSQCDFIRARATWVFTEFIKLKWVNEEALLSGTQQVLNNVNHTDLPVKVYSALSVRNLIRSKKVSPGVETILPQLTQVFLNLLNEVDSDELVMTLQKVIEKYSDKIPQYAPQILSSIVAQYLKLTAKDDFFEDENDSAQLAAMQCLNAVQTILYSVQSQPALYAQLEPSLYSLLMAIKPHLVDVFTDYLEILSMYSYFTEKIADQMWDIFDKYCDCTLDWATDFIPELVAPFDNFITKCPDKFLNGPFLAKLCLIYEKTLSNPRSSEIDTGEACKLLEIVFINCRGRVDSIIPQAITLAVDRLKRAQQPKLKVLLLEVIANALYYNPFVTFGFLESKGWTKDIFGLWFSLVNTEFKRLHDMKITILALTTMFQVPLSQWPPSLLNELKNIVVSIMDLQFKYSKLKADKQAKGEESETSEGFDDDDEDSDMEGAGEMGGDMGDPELDSIMEKEREYKDDEDVGAAFMSGAINQKLAELYNDEEDEAEYEDDEDFTSLLDRVDELKYFFEAMQNLSIKEPQAYQQLLSLFSENDKARLAELNQELANRIQQQQQQPKQ
eukprot:TRINITY_DN8675_c0_g1_i1.p1 TRINITY_DN8675_c0_g1~~TRINITY_DN8675_c0_g1_i1.p1  ORF type:complete len:1052 (+),score=285.77 TRINITY_DN8675_c0_g1_i1:135-3158(+)